MYRSVSRSGFALSSNARNRLNPTGSSLSSDSAPVSKRCSSSYRDLCRLATSCMTGFDTNVLIYSCDKGDGQRQQRALDLLSSTRDGVLLWQLAAEFVAASRKLGAQGFANSWACCR